MKAIKCKCVKFMDGFIPGDIYDVEFAGVVWWAVNDDGKRVCGHGEQFEPIKIPFNKMYRPQIEAGEYTVVTRENRPVEIKIWDLKGDFPVVGVYYDDKNHRDTAVQVTAGGRCSIKPNDDYCDDFFIITSKSDQTELEDNEQRAVEIELGKED